MTQENTNENTATLAEQVKALLNTRSVALDTKKPTKVHALGQGLEMLATGLETGILNIADSENGLDVTINNVVVTLPVKDNEPALLSSLLFYMLKSANFGKDVEKKWEALTDWLEPVAQGYINQGQVDIATGVVASVATGLTLKDAKLGLPEALLEVVRAELVDIHITTRTGNIYIKFVGSNASIVKIAKAFAEVTLVNGLVKHVRPEGTYGELHVKWDLPEATA